jgi:hypothetical protein
MNDRDLTPLPPDVADLLGAGADLPGPPADTERRLYGRIAASVGIAGGIAATGGTAAAAGKTTGGAAAIAATGSAASTKLALIVAAVVAVAGGAGTALYLTGGDDAPAPAVDRAAPVVAPAAPEPAAPEPAPEPAALEPAPEPAAADEPPAEVAEPAAKPAPTVDSLAAERRLLDRARALIAGGDHTGALAQLRAHARRFPRGRLAEERDASWIHALVRAGRTDAARARAARFHRRYPDSLYGRSIDGAIESAPAEDRVTE